jgi:D-threo-aldose 1-dehydrogenase
METVALPGTELTPSRLAFGLGGLMGRMGRRQSLRLLEVALESGITHFDTARSYGYGEAESALGEFLVGRRDEVTVTTKLGIVPPRWPRAINAAKAIGRLPARRARLLRPMLRRPAQAMVRPGRFDPAEARASLETSLRELRTEAVDVLLLHECRPPDLQTDGLLEFLEGAVREGKVRYFGVGTDLESTRYALSHHPEFTHVVQVAHSVVQPALDQLPPRGIPVITHSAMSVGLPPLLELMRDEKPSRGGFAAFARGSRWKA